MVRRSSSISTFRLAESPEFPTQPTRTDVACLETATTLNGYGNAMNGSPFGQMGHIRSRTSTAHTLLRKWNDSFWVHLLPATLVIFKSEPDFQRWALRGDYSSRKSRKVLFYADFDTLGILSGRTNGLNSNTLLANSKGASAKLVSRLQKYSLGDVFTILHGSEALFAFKLERFSNVGVDVAASFASSDQDKLRAFRLVIYQCIQITTRSNKRITREGERSSKKMKYYDRGDCSRAGSSRAEDETYFGSTVAESEMTPFSSRLPRSSRHISSASQPLVVRRASERLPTVAAARRSTDGRLNTGTTAPPAIRRLIASASQQT